MLTKPLIKLIDEAVWPAMVIIVAKMLGLFLAIYINNIQYEVTYGQFLIIFPSINFLNTEDFIAAENFSNVFMFSLTAAFAAFTISRLLFLHESHVTPRLQNRLAKINLENFISSGYHLYHQAVIWMIYLWLLVALFILSSMSKITGNLITIYALITTAILSWLLAKDIDTELKIK